MGRKKRIMYVIQSIITDASLLGLAILGLTTSINIVIDIYNKVNVLGKLLLISVLLAIVSKKIRDSKKIGNILGMLGKSEVAEIKRMNKQD